MEHDSEPLPGLPGIPPEGETILWQGAPEWRQLARRAFHIRKVALYFGLLMGWSLMSSVYDGRPVLDAALTAARLVAPAAAAVSLLSLVAWLTARSTLYTITSSRVVMRFGVALPMTINVPFRAITAAALRVEESGVGDIPLALAKDQNFAFLAIWPHVRPWRVARAEPMMRSVANASDVADILANAMTASGLLPQVAAGAAQNRPSQGRAHRHAPAQPDMKGTEIGGRDRTPLESMA